jgi:hypothetical protein
MAHRIETFISATADNFDENLYLAANADVANAVATGALASGAEHFKRHGKQEGRKLVNQREIVRERAAKLETLRPLLRTEMQVAWRDDGKADFLTEELRRVSQIVETSAVSSNGYDGDTQKLIEQTSSGIISTQAQDCGATIIATSLIMK